MPRKTGSACAACRKAHRSEAECASGVCAASTARAERCQSCRRARRSAAECKQRHPADLAAAQAGAEASQDCRGLEGTDGAARSGDGIMASPNKEMQKDAGEECTTVRRKKGARCAACRQAHRSEEQCTEGASAARSDPCEACRTGRRTAAECAVRHSHVFAAAQSFRGREAADVARSGGRGMPTQLIQTVTDSAQLGEGSVGNHENETAQKVPTRLSLDRRICNVLGDGCGLAPDIVLLSKIAMWAQGSGEIGQKYGLFLPPHPWEDLEGISSLGTDIKLGSMQKAALNAVAGKLKIKSPAS
jgi:hypothetical protein